MSSICHAGFNGGILQGLNIDRTENCLGALIAVEFWTEFSRLFLIGSLSVINLVVPVK